MAETLIPQAQGKAAALSAYLAQGGTPFRMSGRYKKGPMKGKNTDEATAQFERMWASAPDSIKQKYANRSSGKVTDLAPSERPAVTMTARPAPRPRVAPVPSANSGSSFADLTRPVAPPAGGTNSVGDGEFDNGKLVGKSRAEQAAMLIEDARANPVPAKAPPIAAKPTIAGLTGDQIVAPSVLDGSYSPKLVTADGPVAGSPAALPPALPPGQDETGSRGVNGPKPAQVTAPPVPAAPTIGKPSRINSQTGLPMGYLPGDSTAGLDQSKVAESNQRQQAAMDAAVAKAPRAIPVIAPAPSAPARYAAAQAGYQSSGLDPAKAKEMDAVYAGANSLDQAKIAAQSLKRAGGLNRKPVMTAQPAFARR